MRNPRQSSRNRVKLAEPFRMQLNALARSCPRDSELLAHKDLKVLDP
jgi:hypothetical protein